MFKSRYLDPNYFFPHWPFLPVASDTVFYGLLIVAGLSSFVLALGLATRWAAAALLLTSSYFWLIEMAYYNNHYYLQSLLALFFLLTGSKNSRKAVPAWHLYLFQFQICLVYFYGGLAKIQSDWLAGIPISIWFSAKGEVLDMPILVSSWTHFGAAYGGLYLDILAPFFLLWKPGRKIIIPLLLAFHFLNSRLFSIGVFPYLMLGTFLLFLDLEPIKKRLPQLTGISASDTFRASKPLLVFLGCFVLFQVLFPLRHHLLPGDPSWNDRGHWFAWRMMLRTKSPVSCDFIIEKDGKVSRIVRAHNPLNAKQSRTLRTNTFMLARYAQKLAEVHGGVVFVQAKVKLNDREPQFILNPSVGFTAQGAVAENYLTELEPRTAPLALPRVVFRAQWLVMLVLGLWAWRVFSNPGWLLPVSLGLLAFATANPWVFGSTFLALGAVVAYGCHRGRWLYLPFGLVVMVPLYIGWFLVSP